MPEAARPAHRARTGGRSSAPVGPHHPADDLGPVHDPGTRRGRARASRPRASRPPRRSRSSSPAATGSGSGRRPGPIPTMTAAGVFYPADADTAEERLAYYASRFPVVEVDATYYALPSRRLSELWVERTPPDFVFDIKAHALLTGQPTETKRLPKGLREALPATLAEKPRLYAKDLPGRAARRGLAPVRRGPRAARRERPAGRRVPPVPEVVLHLVREPGRDPGGEGGARAARPDGRGRVPQRVVVQREERRADAALPRGRGRSRW